MIDSGIRWIGKIPVNWNVNRLKYLFYQVKNKNIGNKETNLLSLSYGNIIKKNINTQFGLLPENFDTYNIVQYGDIILRLTDMQNDHTSLRIGLVLESKGIITSAYVTIRAKNVDSRYFKWLLYAFDTTKEIYNFGKGVRQNLTYDELGKMLLVVPPLDEQNAIAEYLNKECNLIDSITLDLGTQIALLKQYKQSLITETVTKGLDKNVKMKDSGVEWIGQIPEHWTFKLFKQVFGFDKGLTITKENLVDFGIPVISYGQVHSKTNTGTGINPSLIRFVSEKYLKGNKKSLVHYNDFIFADTSEDLAGIGNCVYVDSNDTIFAGYHSIIARPIQNMDSKYFAYLFLSDIWRSQIRSKVMGIKVYSVTLRLLGGTSLIVPELNEQKDIVAFLDKRCSQIDAIIADRQTQLETLKKHKQSLIYEYVTGKRRVAEVA